MELRSIRQAARELHIGERALRQAVNKGELKAYRIGERTLRVDISELKDWVRGKRVEPWQPRNP